ncbi:MAG: 2-succinyl-6-hydroxy-2,4-cyclohexadiene-1-carboxylate synthase [bacterium]|nr:2-succinyl-6-hydroxy-2,4-cyclohexadiene-1-carboxylate synthase [bacterium]
MIITTRDIAWHALVDGDSDAPPLVMLHGFAQSVNSFTLHVPELTKHFRVVRIDLPGHGGTQAPTTLDWITLCANLHEAVAQIDSRPAHWFGYSQGGRVAIMCALANPDGVKSLALLGASPGIADESEREMRRDSDKLLGQNIVSRGLNWFTEFWESLPIFATQKDLPEHLQALIRNERMACNPSGLKFALEHYGVGTQPHVLTQLTLWSKPLFLSAGELDEKFRVTNEHIAAESRSLLLAQHEFADCGHAAHLEQPEVFTNLLIDFIQAAESKIA